MTDRILNRSGPICKVSGERIKKRCGCFHI
jgi:hypothetical protein